MLKWFLLFLSCLFIVGCEIKTDLPPTSHHTSPPPVIDEHTISLLDFFPQAPVEMRYKGIGNEFAQYTEKFYPNEGPYYPAIMDNGGNRFLRIYKITNNEISLVYEQPDFFKQEIPKPSSLESNFLIQPILKLPLKIGKEVGQWKIESITEMVTVPIGDFSDVVMISKVNEDGSIVSQYWAKKYGKIKDEFLIKDDNGEIYEVSSELQSIK